MRIRAKAAVTGLAAAALVGIASPAFALDCVNNSRPAPSIAGVIPVEVGDGVYLYETVGNWAYIYIAPEDRYEWTFVPPGTIPITPGAHGNYQAGAGFGLLDKSAAVCVGRTNQPGMHGVTADPFTMSVAKPCQ